MYEKESRIVLDYTSLSETHKELDDIDDVHKAEKRMQKHINDLMNTIQRIQVRWQVFNREDALKETGWVWYYSLFVLKLSLKLFFSCMTIRNLVGYDGKFWFDEDFIYQYPLGDK